MQARNPKFEIRNNVKIEILSLRKKSSKASPRRKPGSRRACISWIPASAGMTEKGLLEHLNFVLVSNFGFALPSD